MAVRYQGGKAVPSASSTFNARPIAIGAKTAYRAIQEAIDGAKKLQSAAQGSDNPELIQFANKAVEDLRKASSLVSGVEFDLGRFLR